MNHTAPPELSRNQKWPQCKSRRLRENHSALISRWMWLTRARESRTAACEVIPDTNGSESTHTPTEAPMRDCADNYHPPERGK